MPFASASKVGSASSPTFGQLARLNELQLGGQLGMFFLVFGEQLRPIRCCFVAALAERLLKMLWHFRRHGELHIGRPAVGRLRGRDLLRTQRLAVRIGRAGLCWAPVGNHAFHGDECRAAFVFNHSAICGIERGQIVGVFHGQHMPTQAAETRGDVLAERQLRTAFNRDLIVVVNPAQVVELQMAGDRRGFVGDAFHQIAVAALNPHVIIEQREAGLVVPRGEPLLGDRHADTVAAALPQRSGRRFDAGGVLDFRMPRRAAAPLAKVAELIQRQRRLELVTSPFSVTSRIPAR